MSDVLQASAKSVSGGRKQAMLRSTPRLLGRACQAKQRQSLWIRRSRFGSLYTVGTAPFMVCH